MDRPNTTIDSETFYSIRQATGVDMKNAVELALKTAEETGELAEAVLSLTGAPGNAYKKKTEDDVLEEAADVVLCAMATAFRMIPDLSQARWDGALLRKIEKWERKCKENPRR